jgi:hypothetical protein
MQCYHIKYSILKEKNAFTYEASIDAKSLKSAKHKIESSLAKKENKNRCKSKQTKITRIKISSYYIIGYY